jgi:hypothetical protein
MENQGWSKNANIRRWSVGLPHGSVAWQGRTISSLPDARLGPTPFGRHSPLLVFAFPSFELVFEPVFVASLIVA